MITRRDIIETRYLQRDPAFIRELRRGIADERSGRILTDKQLCEKLGLKETKGKR